MIGGHDLAKELQLAGWKSAAEARLGRVKVPGATAGVGAGPHAVISPLDEHLPPLHLHLVQAPDDLLAALLGLHVDQRPPGPEPVHPDLEVDRLAAVLLDQEPHLGLRVGGRQVPNEEAASIRGHAVLLNVSNFFTFAALLHVPQLGLLLQRKNQNLYRKNTIITSYLNIGGCILVIVQHFDPTTTF